MYAILTSIAKCTITKHLHRLSDWENKSLCADFIQKHSSILCKKAKLAKDNLMDPVTEPSSVDLLEGQTPPATAPHDNHRSKPCQQPQIRQATCKWMRPTKSSRQRCTRYASCIQALKTAPAISSHNTPAPACQLPPQTVPVPNCSARRAAAERKVSILPSCIPALTMGPFPLVSSRNAPAHPRQPPPQLRPFPAATPDG